MSYPRALNVLVIEDHQDWKDQYEECFRRLSQRYPLEVPKWAFCLNDAMAQLAKPWPFHLVILDMRLPKEPGQPESDRLDFGQNVLTTCLERDDYPIPAMLVMTGNLQLAANQADLKSSVQAGFHYGAVVVKSTTDSESAIEAAVKAALKYQDVGIHVRDSGSRLFPAISPREEDLLRRLVCRNDDTVGADLTWWSATTSPSTGWTKTLVGQFLLKSGATHSLSHFFKLSARDGAEHVSQVARSGSLTHRHLKVHDSVLCHSRSLLVTQSAVGSTSRPIGLDDFMTLEISRVRGSLRRMADAIVRQIAAFGDATPEQARVNRLLWTSHSRALIESQWQRRGRGAQLPVGGADPIQVFTQLTESPATVRYHHQAARHGDLNFSNVAVEEAEDGQFNAWVFDVAGGSAGANVRDLATLEITALLHQTPCATASISELCGGLFGVMHEKPSDYPDPPTDTRAHNTYQFILELRAEALARTTKDVYAVLLFDEALLQLGGLGFGSSYNKIHHPPDAAHLAALTAGLVLRTAPHLF